jgi:Zn-dependent protease
LFDADFLRQLIMLPLVILSLSVHEFAHAWAAWRLGDDTAARAGRLTLNPIAHIDVLGTLILPLLAGFGWAKPVPYDPTRFRRSISMGTGSALVSGAGPASNVLLAGASATLLGLSYRLLPASVWEGSPGEFLLSKMVVLNCALALFNLLPVPPLDGGGLIGGLLPTRLREGWHRIQQFGPFLLVAVFFFGGRVIAGPLNLLASTMFALTRAIAPDLQ